MVVQNVVILKNGLKSRVTLESFIERANEVHEYKYDYSKVEYINTHTKVCIICPEHGEFWQTPVNHLQGHPCPACSNRKRMTMEEFVERANKIHKNKYDYSKITYVNTHTKVCIICPDHGEFWETPYRHLLSHGCTMCSGYRSLSIDEFIQKAKGVHGSRYDYSKVEYVNNSTKVCIICPEHGEFWQTPGSHLQGHGCPVCKKSKLELEVMNEFPNFITQQKFDWLKNQSAMSLDFYIPDKNIAIECQGEQHFLISATSWYGEDFEKQKDIMHRDILKYQQCKEHNIEIIYYFPEEFLNYDVDFYKDKKCFHTINDLKNFLT